MERAEAGVTMKALAAVVGALIAIGCAGGAGKPAQEPSSAADTGTLGVPIRRCGAEDSYRYVAQQFRCADGANPLGGKLTAGHDARRGSVADPASGHFIDIYEVPCAEGTKRLYIDLYGCQEQEDRLRQRASQMTQDPVRGDFEGGRYANVVAKCQARAVSPQKEKGGASCIALHSASLYMSGDKPGTIRQMARTCAMFPAPSPDSNFRARIVLETLGAVVFASKREGKAIATREIAALAEALRMACVVPERQIQELFDEKDTMHRSEL
jgi:hypothetical protein